MDWGSASYRWAEGTNIHPFPQLSILCEADSSSRAANCVSIVDVILPRVMALSSHSQPHHICWLPVTGCSACLLSWFSHVWLFSTLWILACQTPLSVGFSRHEYWTGLPCPPPGNLPGPGIKPASLMSPALHVGSLPQALPRKPD